MAPQVALTTAIALSPLIREGISIASVQAARYATSYHFHPEVSRCMYSFSVIVVAKI